MRFCTQIFFVIVVLVFLTAVSVNRSEANLAFAVSPMITDLTINPGENQSGVIALSDDAPAGSEPVTVKVSVMDWTLDANGKAIYSDPGSSDTSCSQWMQVTPKEVTLTGGPPTYVRYSITAPLTAAGSYHCMVFFTTAPLPTNYKGTRFDLAARIGDTIYAQVGPGVRRAKITDLELTASTVTMTVQNTGSSYIRMGGTIKITDATGNTVQNISIPEDAVLSGAANLRILPINLTSLLTAGSYTVTAILDYGGNTLVGARINATLP